MGPLHKIKTTQTWIKSEFYNINTDFTNALKTKLCIKIVKPFFQFKLGIYSGKNQTLNPSCTWLPELRQTLGGGQICPTIKKCQNRVLKVFFQSLPLFDIHQNNNSQGVSCKRKVSQKKKLRRKNPWGGADLPPTRASRVKKT